MIAEERLQKSETLLMQLFVNLYILVTLTDDGPQYEGRELSKSIVLIVFANGEVDEVSSDTIQVDLHKAVEELKAIFVHVTLNCLFI